MPGDGCKTVESHYRAQAAAFFFDRVTAFFPGADAFFFNTFLGELPVAFSVAVAVS